MLLRDSPASSNCMLCFELKQLSFVCKLAVLVSTSGQPNLFLHILWLAWLVFRGLCIFGLLLLCRLLRIHVVELLSKTNVLTLFSIIEVLILSVAVELLVAVHFLLSVIALIVLTDQRHRAGGHCLLRLPLLSCHVTTLARVRVFRSVIQGRCHLT